MSNFFQSNLKALRKSKGLSQDELSQALGIKRTSLSGYEIGAAEPNIELLSKIAAFFGITIDQLIHADFAHMRGDEMQRTMQGIKADLHGTHLRILATTINPANEENVELVPMAARAGYTTGFADPDYIKVLPAFHLPFLSKEKKYRTFPISGDSMPPVSNGSWVTGEYLQNWNFIKDGTPYIVITKNDGIVFKIAFNHIQSRGTLLLCSTNPLYEPYEIHINDVLEVWKFVHYISSELSEPNTERNELAQSVMQLQREVKMIQNTLHLKLDS